MNRLLKSIVNNIVDDLPIDWEKIEEKIPLLPEKERTLVYHLRTVHRIMKFEVFEIQDEQNGR